MHREYLSINNKLVHILKFTLQKCKKIDKDISDAQNYKMELECKLRHLRDKFTEVEQSTDDLIKSIEDMNALKLKVCILYYQNCHL